MILPHLFTTYICQELPVEPRPCSSRSTLAGCYANFADHPLLVDSSCVTCSTLLDNVGLHVCLSTCPHHFSFLLIKIFNNVHVSDSQLQSSIIDCTSKCVTRVMYGFGRRILYALILKPIVFSKDNARVSFAHDSVDIIISMRYFDLFTIALFSCQSFLNCEKQWCKMLLCFQFQFHSSMIVTIYLNDLSSIGLPIDQLRRWHFHIRLVSGETDDILHQITSHFLFGTDLYQFTSIWHFVQTVG